MCVSQSRQEISPITPFSRLFRLAGAIGYLAYASISAGRSYYMEVDAFLADPQYRARAVQSRGTVARDNLKINEEDLQVTFQLRGQKRELPVQYKGALPDIFRAGAEVVIKGQMDSDGVFQAEHLLTKCARLTRSKAGGTGTVAVATLCAQTYSGCRSPTSLHAACRSGHDHRVFVPIAPKPAARRINWAVDDKTRLKKKLRKKGTRRRRILRSRTFTSRVFSFVRQMETL